MAKQEQILIIEPQHELKFEGPFTQPVTSFMKLTNPSNHTVGFKIKTTAPKKYCVRPNSGFLQPKEVTEIAVSLQPFEFDPNEKNKHKFMVQTLIAPDNSEVNLDTLWKEVSTENLMDSKLKCVFEMPVDEDDANDAAGVDANKDAGLSADDKAKRVGDSPSVAPDAVRANKAAAKEVKQLREEESSLRQENLQLKEELMRLRLAAQHTSSPSATRVAAPPTSVSPLLLITAIAMAVLGVILGKFIL